MKPFISLQRSAFAAAALFSTFSYGKNYKLDEDHSSVAFSVKHLVISTVKGGFKKYNASFSIDDKTGLFTKLEATVDVASIDTGSPKRDEHLKGEDFFEISKFPTMTFKMKKYEGDKTGGKAKGDLTLRGVTKPAEFTVSIAGTAKDPWGNERLGASMKGVINRKDFGLSWNKALETGGVLVGEEVSIELDGEGIATK